MLRSTDRSAWIRRTRALTVMQAGRTALRVDCTGNPCVEGSRSGTGDGCGDDFHRTHGDFATAVIRRPLKD